MGKIEQFSEKYQKSIKKLQKKYKKIKRKYFLLFVLPIFLIAVMFQAVKQILKIKANSLQNPDRHSSAL